MNIIYEQSIWINVELDLVIICPERKTNEEIWRHHYENSIKGELSVQAQYGWINEKCWTTRPISLYIEDDNLWYSNNYTVKSSDNKVNAASILFAIIAVYVFIIIIYNIYTLIMDIVAVKKNDLHTKSKQYKCIQKLESIKAWIQGYFGVDTTGWIIKTLFGEWTEIIVQTIALLLYNGYYIFDIDNKDDVYLANKPNFIILFSIMLAFNCFCCGILWFSYGMASKCCHGLLFKVCLFFVDQFCDLFYTIFPFIVLYYDDYNRYELGKTWAVMLGQLNINSGLAITATCLPLFLLCTKCLTLITNAVKTMVSMHDEYFNKWRLVQVIAKNSSDTAAKYQAKLHGKTVSNLQKEMFDHNGTLNANLITNHHLQNLVNSATSANWTTNNIWKRLLICFVALTYIMYGTTLISMVTQYINNSEEYCDIINEQNYYDMDMNGTYHLKPNITFTKKEMNVFRDNPHLFFWDRCYYKVYPFTKNKDHRCQCRVFTIEWITTTGEMKS